VLRLTEYSSCSTFYLCAVGWNIREKNLNWSLDGSRAAEGGFQPQRKIFFFLSPSKGVPAKNIHFKSKTQTVSRRVTWASSERVHLYSLQITILPCPGPPGPDNLYRVPPRLSSAQIGPQIWSRPWGSEKSLSVGNRTPIPKTPTHSLITEVSRFQDLRKCVSAGREEINWKIWV
jgi:hypothetical protein